ncbi:hypothetical protein [Colwellia psychrerythraea]|uniref:Swiss Army Knife 2H phosphoesterase domain-containing protein n=1 Tax=Colwellia psychrerythraea TaxID=28229 RepID=A0A099KQT8_COLPS|nr:hypothetical protein [Colwellia psychrerythraea]KGJ92881.1 hypothetical protein GAB14E_2797 [Colwellia psychrerythraea]
MKMLSMLFITIILCYSTLLIANDAKKNYRPVEKTLMVKLVQLQDNQGLKYIGALVPMVDLAPYLAQMKTQLTTDFADYRHNQVSRDHGQFHMTLINPYEYQVIDQSKISVGETVTITLKGLGRVAQDSKETYFVVVESNIAQLYRQKIALNGKDFHVTLGFKPQDIYGVSKGAERLIH